MHTFVPYTYEDRITATSYLSLVELEEIIDNDYFLDKAIYDALSQEDKEVLLNTSSRTLDTLFQFKGLKTDIDQNLKFPRHYEYNNLVINKNIKSAVAYMFYNILADKAELFALKNEEMVKVKSEKADVVAVEYFQSGSGLYTIKDKLNSFILEFVKPYLKSSFMVSAGRS